MGDNLNGIFANMIQGMGFIGCAPNRVYNMAPPDGGGVEATAEGTELTLHSAAAPLTALTLYGKSEQETTTGAQLVKEENQQFSMEFTQGASVNDSLHEIPIQVSGQFEYPGYISFVCDTDVPFSIGITARSAENEWGTTFAAVVQKGFNQAEIKAITSGENPVAIQFRAYSSPTESIAISVSDVFVKSGPTALPWEPYTGGAPSPSPDYPQEIKSVGDSGTVNVTLSDGGSQSQTLPVQTPNGLPGIPVSFSGNYTDADGQQWVCDEVDFERGVYVQRIIRYTGPFYKIYWAQTDSWFVIASSLANIPKLSYKGFCNISDYYRGSWNNLGHSHWFLQTGGQQIVIHLGDTYNTEEAVEQFIEKNEIVVYYAAETPIETPLSPSELAAYAALRTYSPTTVVSNDAGAWMNVGYKATPQPMTMLARKR